MKLNGCINESFVDPINKYGENNKLLESNKNPDFYWDIYLIPALFLNDVLVREELNPDIATTAICSKLISRP